MSLLENQSYKKRIAFGKIGDNEKTVTIVLNVVCNHEIPKDILSNIENTINDMFFKDYEGMDTIQQKKDIQKQIDKEKQELERLQLKKEREQQRQQEKMQVGSKKQELDYLKQSKKAPVYQSSGFGKKELK